MNIYYFQKRYGQKKNTDVSRTYQNGNDIYIDIGYIHYINPRYFYKMVI